MHKALLHSIEWSTVLDRRHLHDQVHQSYYLQCSVILVSIHSHTAPEVHSARDNDFFFLHSGSEMNFPHSHKNMSQNMSHKPHCS